MAMNEYVEYMKSPEWREKRKELLTNADYICEECGEVASHVHHDNYDSLGEEEEGDVKILCRECHLWGEHGDEEYKDIDDGYGEY
jgi:5-methylcytosine-specific restriction endonuclease McrA